MFAVPRQPRDFAVLFNLFSRRKKTVPLATDAAPTLVEPTEVVESLPAATVMAPAPAEIVEETRAVSEPTHSEPIHPEPIHPEPALSEVTPTTATPTDEPAPIDEPAPTDEAPVVAEVTPADVAVDEATVPSTPAPAPAVVRPPTVPELRAQAKALGLTGYSRLPKAELLRVIAEHHAK